MVHSEAAVEVASLEMIETIKKVIDHKEDVVPESLSSPTTKGTSVKMAVRQSRPIACIRDPPEEVEAREMRATEPQPDFPTIYCK